MPLTTALTNLKNYERNIEILTDKGGSLYDVLTEIQNAINTILAGTSILEVKSTSSAIANVMGVVVITKTSIAALTLAAPTATTDDGKVLHIKSTTAYQHTITTPSNKINGTLSIVTLGGAVGDGVSLVAYQGVWYDVTAKNAILS
jgi:hypothetical protein